MANRLLFGVAVEETPSPLPPTPDSPVWMYREGEAKIFNHPNDVPKNEGWVDSPSKVTAQKKSKK